MVDRKKQKHRVEAATVNSTLAHLLDLVRKSKFVEIPAEYKTSQQWADIWQISRTTAQHHIKQMVAAGVMSEQVFKVPAGNNGMFSVKHYCVK